MSPNYADLGYFKILKYPRLPPNITNLGYSQAFKYPKTVLNAGNLGYLLSLAEPPAAPPGSTGCPHGLSGLAPKSPRLDPFRNPKIYYKIIPQNREKYKNNAKKSEIPHMPKKGEKGKIRSR